MKTLIVKAHSATATLNEFVIATNDGKPDVIKAGRNVNYEFIDQSIARAPNHVITKRVGGDLHISFERDGVQPDLIIEDFYDNEDQALIGLSEDGNYYYYVPDTGEVYDYVTQLEVGAVEGQALGGEPQAAPWWIAAAEGGFGILPWLAGIGLVGAVIGGGGGGKDKDPPAPVKHKPVAKDDSESGEMGETIVIDVLSNDSDKDGNIDLKTVKLIDPSNNTEVTELVVDGEGTWSVNPETGVVTFTPEDGFIGDPTPVDYVVSDTTGLKSDPATITIDYQSRPEAEDDFASSPVGNPVTIDVLENDTDLDEDIDLTTVKLISPTGEEVTELVVDGEGTWSVDPETGEVTFTPEEGFIDDPTPVDYVVSDSRGETSDPAQITIDYHLDPVVTGLGDNIVYEDDAAIPGSFNVSAEAGIKSVFIGEHDISDATNNPVTIITPEGTLVITGYDPDTGDISYTYDPNVLDHTGLYSIPDSHTITVTDNNGTVMTDMLIIDILDTQPEAVADERSIREDDINITGNVITGVNASADTLGADTPTVVIGVGVGNTEPNVDANTVGTGLVGTYGTLTIDSDGGYTYVTNTTAQALNEGDVETDVFSYLIQDADGDTSWTTVSITIKGSNDVPVIEAIDSSNSIVSEEALAGGIVEGSDVVSDTATGTITVTDVDNDASDLSVALSIDDNAVTSNGEMVTWTQAGNTLTGATSLGTVATISLGGFTATGNDNEYEATYTLTLLAPVDHADPTTEDTLSIPVSAVVSDGTGVSTSSIFNIMIEDDSPEAVDDSGEIVEGTTAVLTDNVLNNDGFGADGAATSGSVVLDASSAAVYGSFSLGADGTYTYTLDNSNPDVKALNVNDTLTESFTYTITDADGDTSTATLSITIKGSNDVPVIEVKDPVRVSEEGLPEGIPDEDGNDDTTDLAFVSGVISFTDPDTQLGDLLIKLTGPTSKVYVQGQEVEWSWDNDNGTLTGTIDNRSTLVMEVKVDSITEINSGEFEANYKTTLHHSVDHPLGMGENELLVEFGVTVTDKANPTTPLTDVGNLEVIIEDDSPFVESAVLDIPVEPVNSNVMITLDVSGSMNDSSGVEKPSGGTYTRLEVAKQAINKLLDGYDELGDVRVQLVTFSTDANGNPGSSTGGWLTVAQAKALVNGNSSAFKADGGTNYDAALYAATQAFEETGKLGDATNYSYFLTDGNPTYGLTSPNNAVKIPASWGYLEYYDTKQGVEDTTLGGSVRTGPGNSSNFRDAGIGAGEEAAWIGFLESQDIKSYAFNMGAGLNLDYLKPIAFDGTKTDGTGNDYDSELAQGVTDLSQLDSVLLSTLPPPVQKSLITGDINTVLNGGFGADDGDISELTVDQATYQYDAATNVVTVTAGNPGASVYSFDAVTKSLTINTVQGGKLIFNLDTGEYSYRPTGAAQRYQETIDFTVMDKDGDTASATATQVLDVYQLSATADKVITNDMSGTLEMDKAVLLANDVIGQHTEIGSVGSNIGGTVSLSSHSNTVIFTKSQSASSGSFEYMLDDFDVSDGANVTINFVNGNTITGGSGNDILIGRAGSSDTLNGDFGNDILQGKSGSDTLTGGGGDDVFIWLAGDIGATGSGRDVDVITDFNQGNNKLSLSHLLQGETIGDVASMKEYVSWDDSINTLHVSSEGNFTGGVYDASASDLSIQLTGFTPTGGTVDDIISNYII